MDRIYLDYAATTPLDRRVLDEMLPYFTENFGNPSSSHYFGQRAEMALEKSRSSVAHWLGAYEDEVYFTSGGSESDNLALRGTAFSRRKKFGADTILISPVEHHAVSSTARQLMNNFGFRLIELRVDNYGIVNLDDLREQINNRVALVSIVYANNEIGSINPIEDISRICNEKGVPFHSDAVQACAHMEINQLKYKPDLLSIAAHKLYGPKGVGALVCRKGLSITSQITGGNQENSLRAGTHNVPGIIGLAKALEITNQEMEVQNQKLVPLRDRVIESVLSNIQARC